MFDAGNTYWGTASTSSGWQSTSNWGCYETPRRKDDVFPTTSTDKGTSYVADNGELEDESDVDPPREPAPMVQKLYYFLNRSLFQPNQKMLKGVQMQKKIHDSGHTCLQPTCIMSIYLQMMRWSFQIYHKNV
ncbi:hypothetical protein V6Z11_D09G066600 [Gossypium hirsutum]